MKHNPHYRIRRSLSLHVWKAIKRLGHSADTMELLGCTRDELVQHIGSQMRDGMTWENYGSHWHIDHIRPCASFDLSDPSQARMCFHYSNLQPLEAKANWRKNSRWQGVLMRKPRNANGLSVLRNEKL